MLKKILRRTVPRQKIRARLFLCAYVSVSLHTLSNLNVVSDLKRFNSITNLKARLNCMSNLEPSLNRMSDSHPDSIAFQS